MMHRQKRANLSFKILKIQFVFVGWEVMHGWIAMMVIPRDEIDCTQR